MSLSFHAATVPGFTRMLANMEHLIGKAEEWCAVQGKTEDDVCTARLAPDMLDFAYQVKSTVVHSIKSIHAVREGVFSPDRSEPPRGFAAMRAMLAEAREQLSALTVADMETVGSSEMEFRIGEQLVVPFTGQDFLLSFSIPNFYFHATTAYDILRQIGVPIGKRDYLGPDWTKK